MQKYSNSHLNEQKKHAIHTPKSNKHIRMTKFMNVHAHKHPHTPTKLCDVKANRSFCFFACGMDFNAIIDAFKAAITTCGNVSSIKNCVTSGFIIMDDKSIGGILINCKSLNLPTITECI